MALSDSTQGMVIGENVKVCVDGVMSVFQSRIRELLDEEGIEAPDPRSGEWYPMSKFLDVLEAIEADSGENTLRKVGEATPQFIEWPESTESPSNALSTLPTIVETVHRNLPGDISFEKTGDKSGTVTSTTPYPEKWEEGLIKGTAEEFGSTFTRVEYTEGSDGEKEFDVSW
jgi:hypothetical protein